MSGWLFWDAHLDGFAGLPVNTLGQILGDLLLMGLARPFIDSRRRRDHRSTAGGQVWLDALARANRIQLLDAHLCLAALKDPVVLGAPALHDGHAHQPDLLSTLRTAMGNDAHIEILLPDPEQQSWPDPLGVSVEAMRSAVHAFIGDLAALAETAVLGKLDLRLYPTVTTLSMIRCDHQVWVCLHPTGSPRAGSYLLVDACSDNARVVFDYFNRVQADARRSTRAPDASTTQDASDTKRPTLNDEAAA
jgi:hypothetical protein